MELRWLSYFKVIAEQGSLTAASKVLKVSQPTLSVAVQKLEEKYQTTLFLRDRRGMKLTVSGQELLKHVREVLGILDVARESILGLEHEEAGTFVVGCYELLGAYFLPSFMPQFLARYPRIELTLWNGSSALVQEKVIRREVDFGLVVNPIPHPDLVLLDLFHDAVDFFGRPSPPNTEVTLASAKERIQRGPLIFAGRVLQSAQLQAVLGRDALLPDRLLECGDLELVKSLTHAGVGVGILPRRVAAYGYGRSLVRLHPELPHIPDVIKLVFRADMHRTRAAQCVKEGLLQSGRAMPELERICIYDGEEKPL